MKTRSIFSLLTTLIVALTICGCAKTAPEPAAQLQLTEYHLTGEPAVAPLTFQPAEGTQAEVLAVNAIERAKTLQNVAVTIDGNPGMTSLGESSDLQAVVYTAAEGQPLQTVKVSRGTALLLEAPGGLPSPALPIQALWTYAGHWAVEILYSDETTWAGQVYIDGSLINTPNNYSEAFGFQLLAGKPFFFFVRDGLVGYSYDGKETELPYQQIPHYYCCAESEFNPVQAENMVAFFAKKDTTWYYVELGKFED